MQILTYLGNYRTEHIFPLKRLNMYSITQNNCRGTGFSEQQHVFRKNVCPLWVGRWGLLPGGSISSSGKCLHHSHTHKQ